MPEKLEIWLGEQQAWAEKLRQKTAKDLKRQVQWFHVLLKEAGVAVVEDVATSVLQATQRQLQILRTSFDRKVGLWEKAKELHKITLKPRLASANHAAALTKLIDSEKSRADQVVDECNKVEIESLKAVHASAEEFKRQFIYSYERLLRQIDCCLDDEDLVKQTQDPAVAEAIKASGGVVVDASGREIEKTVWERLIRRLQPSEDAAGDDGDNTEAAFMAAAEFASYAVGDDVELKRRLDLPNGAPSYDEGEEVLLLHPNMIASKGDSVVPKAASHRCTCVVRRRNDGEGRMYTVHLKSHPDSPFDVPQQHIEGHSDDFLAAKISAVHPPSKPTEQTSYDIVFQQARPSLRRLRRHQRRKVREDGEKADGDDAAEAERPPRVRRSREWSALDLSLLKLPQELQDIAFPPDDEGGAAPKAAKKATTPKAAGKKDKKAAKKPAKKPAKGKKAKKTKKDSTPPKKARSPKHKDVAEPAEIVSNPITSVLLPPQRALVRARDKTFQAYCDQFRQSAHDVHQRFAAVVEGEKVWATNWAQMVDLLKQSSDF